MSLEIENYGVVCEECGAPAEQICKWNNPQGFAVCREHWHHACPGPHTNNFYNYLEVRGIDPLAKKEEPVEEPEEAPVETEKEAPAEEAKEDWTEEPILF